MINLAKVNSLPSSVLVGGKEFLIQTDFRYWIIFSRVIEKVTRGEILEVELVEFLATMFPFSKPTDFKAAYDSLIKFFNPPCEVPRNVGGAPPEKVLDYDVDADYIYAAFREQYNINLLDPKLRLHWWEFQALLKGLHGTKLDEIIGYRCFNADDKTKYEEAQKRMKEAWRLPQPSDKETAEQLEKFNSLFEK